MDEYIFGANILENLTTGMYQDSKVCYREYIQNACDQIDKAVEQGILSSISEGQIQIWIENRTISIKDNATGIPKADFEKTLANIADSSKKIGTDKGFRGIGRLCGLAYCKKLKFTSTAYGEDTISIMECDAEKMRDFLNRNVNGEKFTANEVLNQIYKFEYITGKSVISKHEFTVELIDVNEENGELCNEDTVKQYLSFIAPVPYQNTFMFQTEIHEHAKEIGYKIDEYNIKVNGEDIFKKYKTRFKTQKGDDEIFGIEFKDFYDENGNLMMWLWFGVSKFKGVIEKKCSMRGLRLRKENIQIGNEDALQKLFVEDRGQHYFVGELFAVSKELIPNSQRDYFNENKTRLWFEKEIKQYFKETSKKIYYDGSTINSSYDKIDAYNKKVAEHQKKLNNNEYIDAERDKAEQDLKIAEEKAQTAQKKINILKEKSKETKTGEIVGRVIDRIEQERNKEKNEVTSVEKVLPSKNSSSNKNKVPHWSDRLSRCNKKERKLIEQVVNIIMKNTDKETLEKIKKNIEEEFK